METYDCTEDVKKHKSEVKKLIIKFANELLFNAALHDNSKLKDPIEKELFDRWTPELRKLIFGTDEYKKALDGMGEGVKRHYRANRHHPEHFESGINGMTLIDLIEMLSDWMAVAKSKNIPVDLDSAADRFNIDEQLFEIMRNTVEVVG
jgi:hypothetical protein